MRKLVKIHIIILGIVSFGTFVSSCNRVFGIKGKGDIVEREVVLENFTGVDLQSAFDIQIVKGDKQSVIAVGHENIIERLKTNVDNGVWKADLKNGSYKDYQLTIYITSPKINKMVISGSGDITSEGFENLSSLSVTISGSGNIKGTSTFKASGEIKSRIPGSGTIDLEVSGNSHDCSISGSGDITIGGYVNSQDLNISGSGTIRAFDLNCETADINISGSGDMEVFVNQTLDVNIPGSGNVYYKGDPTITQNISGSGSVYKQG